MASDEERHLELERAMYRLLIEGGAEVRFYDLVRVVRRDRSERLPVATLRAVLHDLLTDGIVERVAHGTYRAAPLADYGSISTHGV